jgi:hypothetical protein
MKNNIAVSLCIMISAFLCTSCELFKIDNYDGPSETFKGKVVDVVTGEPVFTDQTDDGIRIRMSELSWTETENPTLFNFHCMNDGTFQNTKVFAGHYNVEFIGPFIPMKRFGEQGTTIADETKTIDLKGGVTEMKIEVQTFLKVEWVGTPTVNDGKITASFKVTRAVSSEDFNTKMQNVSGYTANWLQVSDVRLYVGPTVHVGLSLNDNRYSVVDRNYNGNDFDALLGQTITVTTVGNIIAGRTMFIRAAARVRCPTDGVSRYNYNEAIRVDIPR